MKPSCPPNRGGFTLVEMLVVIVVIASLASVALTVGPKMLARAKATESMQNMRQIGPLLSSYAADNSMKLPAIKGPVPQDDGTTPELQWTEVCVQMIYPDVDRQQFLTKKWWNDNKVFLRNPLLKESAGWAPLNPGYAFNEMIPENVAIASANPIPSGDELLKVSVPLASIPDPGKTPLIAPSNKFNYRYDLAEISGFTREPLKTLLNEGKFPVLFVDGHIETVTPTEYVTRKLYLVPTAPEA